jgi:hypothetical protein
VAKQNVVLDENTEIRLIAATAMRLIISESGNPLVYYSTCNPRQHLSQDPHILTFSEEFVWALDQLIHAYPAYIKVSFTPSCRFGCSS